MYKVPLVGVFEGHLVELRGDRFVNPRGDVTELAEVLTVVKRHHGPPTTEEQLRAYTLVGEWKDSTAGDNPPENDCTLMMVTPAPSSKCVVAYFPDDQHEILVGDPDDDEEL